MSLELLFVVLGTQGTVWSRVGSFACRMYPSVPLTLREAVNDDVFLEKYYIPKGTIMLLTLGPMMRSVTPPHANQASPLLKGVNIHFLIITKKWYWV